MREHLGGSAHDMAMFDTEDGQKMEEQEDFSGDGER